MKEFYFIVTLGPSLEKVNDGKEVMGKKIGENMKEDELESLSQRNFRWTRGALIQV